MNAAKATNVIDISKQISASEPAPTATPEPTEPTTEKPTKTRNRSEAQKAATLANALQRAKADIADEEKRHAERFEKLKEKHDALINEADPAVLAKAKLLIGEV
jgi:hypothetical protein